MGLLGLCVSTILLRSHFAIREAVGLSGGVLNLRKQVTDCGLISFGLFSRFFLRTQDKAGQGTSSFFSLSLSGFFLAHLVFVIPPAELRCLLLLLFRSLFVVPFSSSVSSVRRLLPKEKKNHKCITITLTTTGWKVFQDPTMTTTYGSCRYVCSSLFLCWCVS